MRVEITSSTGVMVGSGNVQHIHQAAGEPVRWPVRVGPVVPLADGFQHREIEASVHTGPGIRILRGMGGVGKTQLAAAVADRAWRSGDIDLLVWITARDRGSIIAGYAEAAAAVGISAGNAQQAAERMRDWLAGTERRWLVVLDDVNVPADLNDWWPPTSGATVVTTRRRDAALAGHERNLVEVGVFSRSEAHAYLAGHLPGCADTAGVAEDLGHLPLALAQAAAFMRDGDVPCGEYRRRFADRRRRLAQLVPEAESLPDQHREPVAVAWSLSIEAADRLRPAGLARPLLELCSLLDPHGIPMDVLTTEAVRRFLGADEPSAVGEAVAVLHRLSLADRGHTLRVHGLVQRTVREHLNPERLDRLAVVAADALLQAWPNPDRGSDALCANVAALASRHDAPLWTVAEGGHPVLSRAGDSLGKAGRVHAAIAHFERLHDSARRHLGPDHAQLLTLRHRIAFWRGEAGDPAGAFAALQQVLAALGPDHPDALAVRTSMAFFLGEAGDVAGAVAAYAQLLGDMTRMLGPHHPNTLVVRGYQAFWRGMAGDAAGAGTAFEQMLPDVLRVFGADHPYAMQVRHNLARWRGQAGDAVGAVAAYQKLLEDRFRVFGPDHIDTLTARGNLAEWRGEAGDPAGAAAAIEQVLADMVRVLGPDHVQTLIARHNLARWRGSAGDPAGAVAAFEQVVADRLRVFGADHPRTLLARGSLAVWRGTAGDAAGATAELERLLPDMLRVLGPDHPDTVTIRDNLARWRGHESTD